MSFQQFFTCGNKFKDRNVYFLFQQNLQSGLNPDLMFLDWFLQRKLSLAGSSVLSCPDILYIVDESANNQIDKEDWKGLNNLFFCFFGVMSKENLGGLLFSRPDILYIVDESTNNQINKEDWKGLNNFFLLFGV